MSDFVDQVSRLLAPLQRRVMMAVGRCVLSVIKDANGSQVSQISLLSDETRESVERMAEYGFTSVPLPGAQGVAVFVGGNRDHGIIVATGDPRFRMKGLQPGEVAIYNNRGMSVLLGVDGVVVDCGGKPVTFKNGTKARFEMPIESTGDIKDNADAAGGKSMSQMRTIYDSHNHNETGSVTQQPNQPM